MTYCLTAYHQLISSVSTYFNSRLKLHGNWDVICCKNAISFLANAFLYLSLYCYWTLASWWPYKVETCSYIKECQSSICVNGFLFYLLKINPWGLAHMRNLRNAYWILVAKLKVRDHWGYVGLDVKIILKCVLETWVVRMWARFRWVTIRPNDRLSQARLWRVCLWNFQTSWANISFWRRSLLR